MGLRLPVYKKFKELIFKGEQRGQCWLWDHRDRWRRRRRRREARRRPDEPRFIWGLNLLPSITGLFTNSSCSLVLSTAAQCKIYHDLSPVPGLHRCTIRPVYEISIPEMPDGQDARHTCMWCWQRGFSWRAASNGGDCGSSRITLDDSLAAHAAQCWVKGSFSPN